MKSKNPLILLAIISISGFVIVVILFFTYKKEENHRYNSFTRLFKQNLITLTNAKDIKFNSYYFSGITTNNIFLGNRIEPSHLLILDKNLTDTSFAKIKMESILYKAAKVTVDSPFFYVCDGTMPFIYRGNIENWSAQRYMYDTIYFQEAIPMTTRSFALRSISNQNIFGKKTIKPSKSEFFVNILEKQIDGIFCTDGMLHYDAEESTLVFVYYYRNQYIRMDTNFNVLYKANTIDTITHAKISVGRISSENSRTMTSPPLIVNRRSCVAGGFLFINSNLLSKSESPNLFNQSSVIDVYNLNNKKYEFSFYLHDYNGSKMTYFKISNKKIIALFDHYILTYEIDINNFDVNQISTVR